MFNLSIDQLNTLGQRAQSMQSMQGFQPLTTLNSPGVISNQQANPTITPPTLPYTNSKMDKYDNQREKQAVGQKNIAGLTNMAGSFGSSLLGIGGAMMGNLQRQSENQSLDYLAYQNDMQNSMQDVNRGGGLQLLMMGGKVKPRKYPQGGVVGGEMPQPVQTEVKEKIITQDGSIFDTKATKKHKDMKSSEITDVLPADSYVISNRIMLKKSKAEKIVLGLQPLLYKEGGDKSKYKEFRLSDIFTKDEMSLSELTDNLRKLYPTDLGDNQKGNIFAQRTSDANKASRALLLGELIKLNEDGKSSNKNQGEVAEMAYGGQTDPPWKRMLQFMPNASLLNPSIAYGQSPYGPRQQEIMPQAQPVVPGTKTNYWDGPIRKDYPDIKPEQRNTEFMIDNSDLLRGLKFNSVNTDPRANRPGGRGAGNGRATVRPKGIAPQPVVPVAPYTPPTPPTYQTPDVQGGVPEGLYKDDPRFGQSTATD